MNGFLARCNTSGIEVRRKKSAQWCAKVILMLSFAGYVCLNATAQQNQTTLTPLKAPTGSLLKPAPNTINPNAVNTLAPPLVISPGAIVAPTESASDKTKLGITGNAFTAQNLVKPGAGNVIKLARHRVRVISAKDLATMAARLAAAQKALEAEAKEQAKKDEQEQKELAATLLIISKLKVADSAKVSLKSPRVAWAKLDAYKIETLDFDKNQMIFTKPPAANTGGSLTLNKSDVYCIFTPPEDGFYMADFVVESGDQLKLNLYEYADVSTSPISQNTTVPPGVQHAVVTLWAVKSQPRTLILVSNQGFAFNSCEVTRLKSG